MLTINNAVLEWKRDGSFIRVYEHMTGGSKNVSSTGAVFLNWEKRSKAGKEAEMMADALQAIVFDNVDPRQVFKELSKIIDFGRKL